MAVPEEILLVQNILVGVVLILRAELDNSHSTLTDSLGILKWEYEHTVRPQDSGHFINILSAEP